MDSHNLNTTIPLYSSTPKPALPVYSTDEPAHDSFGRRINYLRISLTDRCNLRCVYCMPAVGMQFMPRPELLTSAELLLVVRAAAVVGFQKIRLTGGEPTLRPDLVEMVRAIKATPGIEHIAMTTNALRLGKLAGPLKEAGLDRVQIGHGALRRRHRRQPWGAAAKVEVRQLAVAFGGDGAGCPQSLPPRQAETVEAPSCRQGLELRGG